MKGQTGTLITYVSLPQYRLGLLSWKWRNTTSLFLYNISSGFQSQNGFCLIHFCGGECTPGATPANLLMTSMVGGCLLPYMHVSAKVGIGLGLNRQSPAQKTNVLPLCQRTGFYDVFLQAGEPYSPPPPSSRSATETVTMWQWNKSPGARPRWGRDVQFSLPWQRAKIVSKPITREGRVTDEPAEGQSYVTTNSGLINFAFVLIWIISASQTNVNSPFQSSQKLCHYSRASLNFSTEGAIPGPHPPILGGPEKF